MPKTKHPFLKDRILTDLVSNQHPSTITSAEELTAHITGDATPTDFDCCTTQPPTVDPLSNITPAGLFLATIHTNNLTPLLSADWETDFNTWWAATGGNMALIRTAVDAATHVTTTGITIPNLAGYLTAAITDLVDWATTSDDQPWTIHAFEARALGCHLSGIDTLNPGAYTHPFHQLVHLALNNAPEPTLTGVYGELCKQGAMGHTRAPYQLHQLRTLAESGTI